MGSKKQLAMDKAAAATGLALKDPDDRLFLQSMVEIIMESVSLHPEVLLQGCPSEAVYANIGKDYPQMGSDYSFSKHFSHCHRAVQEAFGFPTEALAREPKPEAARPK
jgi:alpha-D-ribose 1-methylphosphonate 5-triphosphate synthase subunit PhnH